MAKRTSPLLPHSELRLQQLGGRIRLARMRRRLTAKQVAERAGMTPITLRSLERGSPGVTLGAYLAVLQVLGADADLDLVLKDDPLGRKLQDSALTQRTGKATRPTTKSPSRGVSRPATVPLTLQENEPPAWGADSGFVDTDSLTSLIKMPNSKKKVSD